jgi:hypothetical protein
MVFIQREISHIPFGYYDISASGVKILVSMTGQIVSDLTLSLLCDFT